MLQPIVKESKSVLFNGDNYSEAWHAEAERRGLPTATTVDSLPDIISPKAIGLFGKYGVLSERELHSRYEIFLENYRKTINIESQLTIQIAQRMILPAALRYQEQVASAIGSLKATGVTVPKTQVAHLSELVAGIEASRQQPTIFPRPSKNPPRETRSTTRSMPGSDRPGHERRPLRRRSSRDPGRRRPLAAADVSGNAIHQVIGQRHRRERWFHRRCPLACLFRHSTIPTATSGSLRT